MRNVPLCTHMYYIPASSPHMHCSVYFHKHAACSNQTTRLLLLQEVLLFDDAEDATGRRAVALRDNRLHLRGVESAVVAVTETVETG